MTKEKFVFVVIITDVRYDTSEVARVFSVAEDAIAFVEDCKSVEANDNYEYLIQMIQFDGDPLNGY